MANKKSQSISLNTIIIAIIALVVLIVLILVFTGKIKMFGEGVDNCVQRGGSCENADSRTKRCPTIPPDGGQEVYATYKNTECDKDGKTQVCCVRIL